MVVPEVDCHHHYMSGLVGINADTLQMAEQNNALHRSQTFTSASDKYLEATLGHNQGEDISSGGLDCYRGDYEVAYMYPHQRMASDGAWSSSQSSLTSSCYTEPVVGERSPAIEATSLKESMQQNRHSLQNKLLTRRPVAILVEQGIIPPLQTPPTIYTKRQKLARAKTGDFLKHKIQRRPERAELVQQHILPDTHVDPCIAERQRQLKRARLVDDLNERLSHRPGPLDLVRANVLQPDKNISDAIQRGLLRLETEPSECKKMCINNTHNNDLHQVEHRNRVRMYPGSVSPENNMDIDPQQDIAAHTIKNATRNATASGVAFDNAVFQTSLTKIEFKNAHTNNSSQKTAPLLNHVHSAPDLSLMYPESGPRLEPVKRVGPQASQPDARPPMSSSSQYKMVIFKSPLPPKPGMMGGKVAPGKKNLPPPPPPNNCNCVDETTPPFLTTSINYNNYNNVTSVTTTATTNKLKTIKFHEYKGPPGILTCGNNNSASGISLAANYANSNCFNASNVISTTMPALPPCSSTYEFVLQQQRLFLQLQMECQQTLGLAVPPSGKQIKSCSNRGAASSCKTVIAPKGKCHLVDEGSDKQFPPATTKKQAPIVSNCGLHRFNSKNSPVADVKSSVVAYKAPVLRAEPGEMFTTTLVEIRPKMSPNSQPFGPADPDKNIEIYEFTDDPSTTLAPSVATGQALDQKPKGHADGGLRDDLFRNNSAGFINFFDEFGDPPSPTLLNTPPLVVPFTNNSSTRDTLDHISDLDVPYINTKDIPLPNDYVMTPAKAKPYPAAPVLVGDNVSASFNFEPRPQAVSNVLTDPRGPVKTEDSGTVQDSRPPNNRVTQGSSCSATHQSETLISSTGISAVESVKKNHKSGGAQGSCNSSKGKRRYGQASTNNPKANPEVKNGGEFKDGGNHKTISNGHKNGQPKLIVSLESLTVPELRAELKKRKMTVSGPKPYLIERLKPFADEILEILKNGCPLLSTTGCSPVNKTDVTSLESLPIPDVGTCQPLGKDSAPAASIANPETTLAPCREQNGNNLFTLFKTLNGASSNSNMSQNNASVETLSGNGQFLTNNTSSGALSSDMMTLLLLANNLRQLRDQQNTLFMNQNNILSHAAQKALSTSPTYNPAINGVLKQESCPTPESSNNSTDPLNPQTPYTIMGNNSSSPMLHPFKDSINGQINDGRAVNACGPEAELPLPIAIKLQREKIAELQRQLNRSQLELEIQLAAATEKFNATPKSIQIPARALIKNQPPLIQKRIILNGQKPNEATIPSSNNKPWDLDEKGCQSQSSYVNMLENYNEIILQHQVLTNQLKNLKIPKGQDPAPLNDIYCPQVALHTNGKGTLDPISLALPSLSQAYPQSHNTTRPQAASFPTNNNTTITNPCCYSPRATQAKKMAPTASNHQYQAPNEELLLQDLSLAERQKLGFDSFLSEYMNRAKAQAVSPPPLRPINTSFAPDERSNYKGPEEFQNQFLVQIAPNPPAPAPFNHSDFLDLFPPEDDLEMLTNSPLPIDINTFNWDKLMTAD